MLTDILVVLLIISHAAFMFGNYRERKRQKKIAAAYNEWLRKQGFESGV